jgi:hypothetical protein
VSEARYRFLEGSDLAALPDAERAKYQRERVAFDREVAHHVEHGRRHGWIDVGTAGREVRFSIPVALLPRRR